MMTNVASRLRQHKAEAILLLLLTPVVIVGGFLVSLGNKLLDVMLLGIVGGGFLLFLPLRLLMILLIVTTLLIAGTAEYFGHFSQAQWIPFLMAFAYFIRLPLEMLNSGRRGSGAADRAPALYWLIAAYLVLILLAAAANQAPIMQTVVGAKSYMFFWSVMFLVLASDITPKQLDDFWKAVVIVAAAQLPFVLYQHFVIMKTRVAMYAFDAVVGTFGGDPKGGGSSATLSLYMLVAALYATALYRERLLARRLWVACLGFCLLVVALGETKVMFVLVPPAFAIVYWDRIKRSFGALVGFSAAMVLVVGALLAVYQFAYWDDSLRSRGMLDGVEKSISYVVDPHNMTRESGEVGRGAALNLWWQDRSTDALRRTIGYGPGASRATSNVSVGEVAKRYQPYAIDANAAAALLWDTGVIGLLLFSAILVSGALLAYRVADRVPVGSLQRAGLRTATAVLFCLFITIPYNRSVVDQAAVQLLMVFCLAYGAYWHRSNGAGDQGVAVSIPRGAGGIQESG